MSADTIAAILERDPWQTPIGVASLATARAEQALKALQLAPESRRTLAPEAVRQLVRARRLVVEARGLCGSQPDREQLVYLGELLDECARGLGLKATCQPRAVA